MTTLRARTGRTVGRKKQPEADGFSVVTLGMKLEVALKKDGDQWVAWCIPLDNLSQGGSKQGAIDSIQEAVHLWLESCIDRNVLDNALAEAGFRKLAPGERVAEAATLVEMIRESGKENAREFHAHDYIEVSIPAYIAVKHSPDLCAIP